jgi:hypothetical protein
MKKTEAPTPGWTPEFTLDLATASSQSFQELVEQFYKNTKAREVVPAFTLKSGWNKISPQAAEDLLRRNHPGGNREPSLSTVVYYATQMQANAWPRTGQPLIFTADGWLRDGQHRLWAAYLGLVSFETYVVTDVPVIENLFAYLDNVKPRNASTALATAGLNGLSPLISQIVQLAFNFEHGVYTCQKKKKFVRMAPIQVIHYLETHPEIRRAAKVTASEYRSASEAIGWKEIAGFVAYKIIALHDEDVCERFMEQIGFDDDLFIDHDALKALNTFLRKEAKKTKDQLPKHLILAHVIKAFNAWISGTPIKRVSIATDDEFPQFAEATKSGQETETE